MEDFFVLDIFEHQLDFGRVVEVFEFELLNDLIVEVFSFGLGWLGVGDESFEKEFGQDRIESC